jgi:hypothetical protein
MRWLRLLLRDVTSAGDFANLLRQAAASIEEARAHVTAAREPTVDTMDEYRRAFEGSANSSAEEAIGASRKALVAEQTKTDRRRSRGTQT